MRDLSMQVKGSVKVYGVLDAVEYKMRFPKAFGQALQCVLVHLWVRDFMVFMLMGVVSPGGGGCPGRAAFTKVLEMVGFLQ